MPFETCGVHVPGPVIVPRRNGLFTVTEPITPADRHWEGAGVNWDDLLCGSAHSTDFSCPNIDNPKIEDRDFNNCCASPFTVYASYDCPPVGHPANQAFDVATQRLLAHEEREVERIFWEGTPDSGAEQVTPSLQEGNSSCGITPVDLTPSVTGAALSPTEALAVLESNLAECVPGVGVIHANYGVASYLAGASLIYREGNSWFTATGQRIAFGAGYPGTGPGGDVPDDGETWLFATGPVAVWRSDIFLTPPRLDEAVDRSLNNVRVYAERVYAVGFSCCLFAVRMALTDCC